MLRLNKTFLPATVTSSFKVSLTKLLQNEIYNNKTGFRK